MTNIAKTPHGEMSQFIQNLHSAGFTYEDVQYINRDPVQAQRMYATLTDGVLPAVSHRDVAETPPWYVEPLQQLNHFMRLNHLHEWGFLDSDFPSIPDRFTLSKTEVLMMAVYLPEKNGQPGLHRTFDELWNHIEVPNGHTKHLGRNIQTTPQLLRQISEYDYYPGIRWVAYDTNTYFGLSPEAALRQSKVDNVQLAGLEVLMSALLFPDSTTSLSGYWGSHLYMAGLQFSWKFVPYLKHQTSTRQLEMHIGSDTNAYRGCTSPSVREI